MAQNIPVAVFNGGEIGQEVMIRTNLEGYGATAETMENWLPRPAGPMDFRPGWKFCATLDGTVRTRGYDYVFDTESYGILLSPSELRIETDGGVIVRPTVTAAINNGTFTPPTAAAWTDISSGSGTATGGSTGLVMTSNGTSVAGFRQAVTINQIGTTHGLRVTVAGGPVELRLGSSSGGSEYLNTSLRAGVHSIGVVPTTATLYIDLSSTSERVVTVTSIAMEAAGDLVLPTPWTQTQIDGLRHDQTNDVIWFTSGAGKTRRIERRSAASWSIVDTAEVDGPFLDPNTDQSYTLTPSVQSGNGTLTASRNLFLSTHVGALFKLTHSGQFVSSSLGGVEQYTNAVKVQGVGSSRTFEYTIAGTFTATVTLQRSIGNTTSWTDVSTFAAAASSTYLDGTTFDNQTVYYRFGIKTGNYTSGTATATIRYTGGSTDGVVRITSYTSATVVGMEVLEQLGAITATTEWAEGAWSDAQVWPKAVSLYDGRLWFGGSRDRFWGSKSDDYESQDIGGTVTAADDAIARNIAIGSARRILSMIALSRLIVLTAQDAADIEPVKIDGGPPIIKSNSFDEPLTSTNLTVRDSMSSRGIYVDRNGHHAMELYYSVESQDFAQRTLMRLHEDLGRPGIRQIATSRRPYRRLWFVRTDGVLLTKLYDVAENAMGWARCVTDGEVESVYVKPAADEDKVMLVVKRTIGGVTKRYLEQIDPVYLASAASANRVDSYVRHADAAGFTTMTGLDHLEGETVRVWANGARHPDCVVASGQIALNYSVTQAVAGLPYTALYKSSILPMGARAGTPLTQIANSVVVSMMLINSTRTVKYGSDFTTMDQLPDRRLSTAYDTGPTLETCVTEPIKVPGDPSRDPRFCLKAESPYPVTVGGYVVTTDMNERAG